MSCYQKQKRREECLAIRNRKGEKSVSLSETEKERRVSRYQKQKRREECRTIRIRKGEKSVSLSEAEKERRV